MNSTIHFSSLYDMRPGQPDRAELHNLVYDIVPPRTLEVLRGKSRVFVFAIDTSLLPDNDVLSVLESLPANASDEIALVSICDEPTVINLRTQTPTVNGKEFFVPGDEAVPRIVEFVRCCQRAEKPRLFGGIKTAIAAMDGVGGRLILFTSGRSADDAADLSGELIAKSISLSVVKALSMPIIELWAQITGGLIAPLSAAASLRFLFTERTAWFGSAVLRTNNGADLLGVMGPCCLTERGAVIAPALTPQDAIAFEFVQPALRIGDFCFQLALRYIDDKGALRIRVINGRIRLAQAPTRPIDDAAVALFLSRNRAYGGDLKTFHGHIAAVKALMGPMSLFPVFAFTGTVRDQAFVVAASVEKFLLSLLVTAVRIGRDEFKVVWAAAVTIVWPRMDAAQEGVMRDVARALGVAQNEFFYPESEREFAMMNIEAREAAMWFRQACPK
jgi:hypothetical protein